MSLLTDAAPPASRLSTIRVHAMRAGYLFMGLGLAVVKWPLLPEAHTMPLFEGVTLCLLVAMSLLAFVGLWHPIRLLPLLVLESLWKVLWLSVVAVPTAMGGGLDSATTEVAVTCSLVVVILAVTPWRYVRRTYLPAAPR